MKKDILVYDLLNAVNSPYGDIQPLSIVFDLSLKPEISSIKEALNSIVLREEKRQLLVEIYKSKWEKAELKKYFNNKKNKYKSNFN